MRYLTIENYKNIGVQSPQKFIINEDLHKVGGLVVVLGENNVGKSNVLNALCNFDENSWGGLLSKKYRPNFLENGANPKLSLCYEYESDETQERHDFSGETFALYFTQGSLEKGLEIGKFEDIESYEAHLQELFDSAKLLALYDLDEQSKREEIRLILEDKQMMFLCSVKKGQKLECFAVIEKTKEEIKNYDKAINLECKICIDLKKKTKCDDTNKLKDYLKLRYENEQNTPKKIKTENFRIWLDENDELCEETSFPKKKVLNVLAIRQEIEIRFGEFEKIFKNSRLTLPSDFEDKYIDLAEKYRAIETVIEENL